MANKILMFTRADTKKTVEPFHYADQAEALDQINTLSDGLLAHVAGIVRDKFGDFAARQMTPPDVECYALEALYKILAIREITRYDRNIEKVAKAFGITHAQAEEKLGALVRGEQATVAKA